MAELRDAAVSRVLLQWMLNTSIKHNIMFPYEVSDQSDSLKLSPTYTAIY